MEINCKELFASNPELFKDTIKKVFNLGLVKIQFTKINGEIRDMTCTTNKEFIPKNLVEESERPNSFRKKNDNVHVVVDINKNEWRSFKWENLNIVNIIEQRDNSIYEEMLKEFNKLNDT